MKHLKAANSGFSLMELMVAVAIGTIVSLSMASLVADMSKANASTRATLDYINFAAEVKSAISTSTACTDIFGTNTPYNGNQSDIAGITINGIAYTPMNGATDPTAANRIRGTELQLEKVTLMAPQNGGPPQVINFVDPLDGVQKDFNRFNTKVRITARKYGKGGTALRPIEFPVTIFSDAGTNRIRLCSASDVASSCRQMGGVFIPGNPNASTPTSDRCDILPAFGGCAKGGSYSETNGACSANNPYTGACSCPARYAAHITASFPATKDASFVQKECLFCSDNVNPVDGTNNTPLQPLLNLDEEEWAYECETNPPSCSACTEGQRTSLSCICIVDPELPECQGYSVCTDFPGSCECLSLQASTACANGYNTPECQAAMAGSYACSYGGGMF